MVGNIICCLVNMLFALLLLNTANHPTYAWFNVFVAGFNACMAYVTYTEEKEHKHASR